MFSTRNCYIYLKQFKLLPHFIGQTYVKTKTDTIVVPSVKNIFPSSELSPLTLPTNDSLPDNTIFLLQQIIIENNERFNTISIDCLQRKLTEIRKPKYDYKNNYFLPIIIVIILITSCAIFVGTLLYVSGRRTCQPNQPQQDADAQSAHTMPTAIHVYDLSRDNVGPESTRFAVGQLSTLT